jgi:uncharacterized protein involved in exopolysaccharide biosynthesis
MLPDHPTVQARRVEEQEIRQQLRNELDAAIRDVQAEQARLDAQVDTLSKKSADVQEQIQRLAAAHEDYSNQVALVRQQTSELRRAQHQVSQAQSDPAARPDPGSTGNVAQPIAVTPPAKGPGRLLVWAAGIVGGLFVSLGLYTLRRSRITATVAPRATATPVSQTPVQAASRPAPQVPLPPVLNPTPSQPQRIGMTLRQALERCAEKRGC